MATVLADGTVIPSYLDVEDTSYGSPDPNYGNIALRLGEVVKVIYPTDSRSRSKKIIEYDVATDGVTSTDGSLGGHIKRYLNCVMNNPFGGLADKLVWTARAQPSDNPNDKAIGIGLGSKVILLCVDGETNRGIIIGGVRDVHDTGDVEKDGHHLHFAFNGLNAIVNDDGELTATFNGKTKANGKLDDNADKDSSGTYLKMDKTGAFKVASKKDKDFFLLDRKNKLLHLKSSGKYHLEAADDVTVDGDKTIYLKGTKGLRVGAATDSMLKGTTYRNAESNFHQSLLTDLTSLTTQIGIAAAALAGSTAPLSVPVVGGSLAAPFIVTASKR